MTVKYAVSQNHSNAEICTPHEIAKCISKTRLPLN